MTQISQSVCPHCGAPNPAGSVFCETCGKAMPLAASSPRLVAGDTLAYTTAGVKLQSDELLRTQKKASGALLAVAIIQTVAGGIAAAVISSGTLGRTNGFVQALAVGAGIVAALFWGLYVWSRRQPLPAAIVGLVVYGTLVTLNVVTTLSASASGGGPPRGLGIGILDIIIIVVLARAITAGLKHRRLMQEVRG